MLKKLLIIWSLILLIGIGFCLKITEVYFDGTDEWIEIYNQSGSIFSGVISIFGVKSSTLTLPIYLQPNSSIILGDNLGSVAYKGLAKTGLALNISDSLPINISIVNSGINIDNFIADMDMVKNLDNKQTSIQKIIYNTGVVITGTNLSMSVNNALGYIINPHRIFIFSGSLSSSSSVLVSGSSSSSVMTGLNTSSSSSSIVSSLTSINNSIVQINQINPFDTQLANEYLLIKFNSNYNGNLDFKGLGTSSGIKSFNINALSGSSLVITDGKVLLSDYQNVAYIDSISLNDSGECIEIIGNGVFFDKVCYSNGIKNKALDFTFFENGVRYFHTNNNFKPLLDFSKVKCRIDFDIADSNLLTIKSDDLDFSGEFSFNRKSSGNIFTGSKFSKVFNSPIYALVDYSGNHVCSSSFIQIDNTNNTIKDNLGLLKITEINSSGIIYPEYVEIKSIGNYSGYVTFSGFLAGDKTFNMPINILSGDYLLLVKSMSGFIDIGKIKYVNNLSLLNSGEKLSILGQYGQVLDSINYEESKGGNSLYLGVYSGANIVFNRQSLPTPGYSGNILPYCSNFIQKYYSCGINLQNTSSIYYGNSINLQAILDDVALLNSSLYDCRWIYGSGNIITGCNPGFTKFDDYGIIPIKLEITKNNQLICKTESKLNYPAKILASYSSENYYFGLYNKYKDLYNSNKSKVEHNYITGQSMTLNLDLYDDFKLYSIIPNPIGSDKSREVIKLINLGVSSINLNNYKLSIAKKSYNLSGTVEGGQIYSFTGNFAMKNSSGCVELSYMDQSLDKLCYDKVKSGETVYSRKIISTNTYTGIVIPSPIQTKNDATLTKSTLKKITAVYKRETTKFNKIIKKSNKEKSSIEKKLVNLEKKLFNMKLKLEKEKQKYIKLKFAQKNKLSKLNLRINELKSKIKSLNLKYKLYKKTMADKFRILSQRFKIALAYNSILNKTISTSWQNVYKHEKLDELKQIYKSLDVHTRQGNQFYSSFGINFKVTDIKTLFEVNTGKISLNNMLKSYISNNIQTNVKSFKSFIKN